jgi:hypothetical protein
VLNCPEESIDEVVWEVDGQRIDPNVQNDRMHVLANGSLVLGYFADSEELANLRCVATKLENGKRVEVKVKTKDEVYMQLEEKPPRVDIPQPRRLHGQVNKSITIDCLLVEGSPLTTRIRWTKDNVNLEIDRDHYFVLVSCRVAYDKDS